MIPPAFLEHAHRWSQRLRAHLAPGTALRRAGEAGFLGLWITALHLAYLTPGGPTLQHPGPVPLFGDEGTLLYDGYRITDGEVLYRDYFEFQGPVPFYVIGALFRITGPSMLAGRGLLLVVTTASALLIALLVSRFAGRMAGVAAATLHATAFLPLWPVLYAHWVAELFLLAALASLTWRANDWRAYLVAGACLGLAAMSVQSLGIPALVAVLGVAAANGIAQRSGRVAFYACAIIMGGWLLAVLPWVIGFAAAGALDDMLYCMFRWPFTNYLGGQWDAPTFGSGLDLLAQRHLSEPLLAQVMNRIVLRTVLIIAYALPAAAVAVAVAALVRVWRGASQDLSFAWPTGAALAAMTPLYLGMARTDITHVAFCGGVMICGVIVGVAALLPPDGIARRALTALVVAAALAASANHVYKAVDTEKASLALGSWHETMWSLPYARYIDETTAPDARVVVTYLPGFYYLFVRRDATPLTFLYPYYTPQQRDWLARVIAAQKPELVFVDANEWNDLKQRAPELGPAYFQTDTTIWRRTTSKREPGRERR